MDYNVTFRKKDKGQQCIISYKDNDGKWKQKSKQGFKAQKDAKLFIEETLKFIEAELKKESSALASDYKSIQFKTISNEFLEHLNLYMEHNTTKGYKNAISKFKELEDIEVFKIKKGNIVKCVDKMVKDELKISTIQTYICRVKQIFEYYKENYNTAFEINLKIKLSSDKTSTNKKALTKGELDKLLKDSKLIKSKFYIVAYIAANTGLRCGEILGLTWDNVDEKNMLIEVDKQWKVSKSGKSDFGTLKSKNSNRKVPISTSTLNFLKRYKKESCRSIDNRIAPFNKNSIDKYLNPLLKELAGISLHELRHTFATLLIANGIDFKTAAKILGHTVEMTLKTYSHVTDDMMKNASNKISKIF